MTTSMASEASPEGLPDAPRPRTGVGVTAIVVTYDREHMIGDCLDALAAQTVPLDRVIVIDNASHDASGRIAHEHAVGADVVRLRENHGGAGGFAAGLALALARPEASRWFWLLDDDTIPAPSALEELLAVDVAAPGRYDVLSSTAVWTDGRVHPMNHSRSRLLASRAEVRTARRVGARPIRTASFVAALLRASAVERAGLPIADYFIWSDDFEYTARLLSAGRGAQVPSSIVEHRTKRFASSLDDPGDRFYYDVRNRLWALLASGSFRQWEAAAYGARSVQAWMRTMRTFPHLREVAARALHDAIAHPPARSAEVLAGEEVADEVRRADAATPEPARFPLLTFLRPRPGRAGLR